MASSICRCRDQLTPLALGKCAGWRAVSSTTDLSVMARAHLLLNPKPIWSLCLVHYAKSNWRNALSEALEELFQLTVCGIDRFGVLADVDIDRCLIGPR